MYFQPSTGLLAISSFFLSLTSALPAQAYPPNYQPPASYEPPPTYQYQPKPYQPKSYPPTYNPPGTYSPPKYGGHGGGGNGGSGSCTFAKKRAAIQHEIDTISSHSFKDANLIPLAPTATRTFFVTPNELPEVTIPVNVGFSAQTVRSELVLLASLLDAGVPKPSVHYINNANGTVTSDFVQTDRIVLPRVHVREIHEFNDACQITKITGFVHGNIVCPVDAGDLIDDALIGLCTQLETLGLVGTLQDTIPDSDGLLNTGILRK